MTDEEKSLIQMASRVKEMGQLAQDLYDQSESFPAVNRNTKRILASIEVLRMNLEQVSD